MPEQARLGCWGRISPQIFARCTRPSYRKQSPQLFDVGFLTHRSFLFPLAILKAWFSASSNLFTHISARVKKVPNLPVPFGFASMSSASPGTKENCREINISLALNSSSVNSFSRIPARSAPIAQAERKPRLRLDSINITKSVLLICPDHKPRIAE